MSIGDQLMRNIEHSTNKYERIQAEFKENLKSFHQNQYPKTKIALAVAYFTNGCVNSRSINALSC